MLLRIGSAVLAVVMLGVLAALLVSSRKDTTRSSAAFCRRIADVSALSDALASGDGSQIRGATARLHRAEAVAPPEIDAQMKVLVAYADGLDTTIATAGSSPGAVDDALRAAVHAQQGQNDAVVAAGSAVQYYTKATCDIDLLNGTTGTGGATPSTG